jgi:hypothetical protein
MTSEAMKVIGAILILALVLFMAAKLGTIGGGGGSFDRDKSPFNYWVGVWFTAVMMFVMILVLIGSFVQPDRFHLD